MSCLYKFLKLKSNNSYNLFLSKWMSNCTTLEIKKLFAKSLPYYIKIGTWTCKKNDDRNGRFQLIQI